MSENDSLAGAEMRSEAGAPPGGLRFGGRLALQQRVLPSYRVAFFDTLATRCDGGMSLLAGEPRLGEAVIPAVGLDVGEHVPARNRDLFRRSLYINLQSGIEGWLEATDPDALVIEANPRYLSNRTAIAWMRARRRPVLGWGLGAPSGNLLWGSYLRGLDALIAYSSQGAEEYRALGARRTHIAINSMMGPPPPYTSHEPSDPPRVIFVGRLQERKRVDNLLMACRDCGYSPQLMIVGDGPVQQPLEQMAREVYPAARFLGPLQGAAVDRAFQAADLFALPGTGGLAVQHAMYFGLPVIAAEGDGTQRDLVRAGNGWVVEPDDVGALSGALREALSKPERLSVMGAESHRIVTEEANIEVMADVFVTALNELTGE